MRIDLTKIFSAKELAIPVADLIEPFDFIYERDLTIEEVLESIQSQKIDPHIEFFYVVDNEYLLGYISMKDLLYYPASTPLEDILRMEMVKLSLTDSLEKALKNVIEHEVLVLPVVDEKNRLRGVFEIVPNGHNRLYESKKIHEKHLKEEFFQLIGFSLEQTKAKSTWKEFRYRMPWLFCNLIGGLICAFIGEFFQFTLVEFVILALFIPLVLTLCEAVSIQAMTLSLRFIHFKRIYWTQVLRRLIGEWKATTLLASTCAILIGASYFAWGSDFKPMLAIALSLLFAMICSATFGALMPILLHLLRIDAKVAAGPVSLMLTDILTITVYLSCSTAILL